MADTPDIEFYHAPNTRSTGVRVLLEELGAPHRLHVLNMRAGEHLGDAYRAINPMAKVPAIRHGDALVTEQAAVYMYLADLFPAAGLAPALTDPARGTYLRWMVFYGSCFEPAVIDRHLKREAGPRAMSAYADYDSVIARVTEALNPGPYLLGDRFSAADVLWGSALGWTTGFGLVAPDPALSAYVDRIRARPAFRTVAAADARLAQEHEAAAPGAA
ncbi:MULTISPECIES: glutathione S-transferase family protein [Methylobacterium]|uniref:glutathione S-transferase family protein n=1 Tax=Methylobacterium TaxID=407 RepID=UPI0011C8B2E2|nr:MULTISPECIES: glutathione S-transferase family protein [Methylobacterium]TXN43684.1 glutathione S-transferase family protein [Methylobacterium sp. WL7]TXN57435.1 glutathione S-transferase family protein [Methylobacterium sp. WL18]GJE20835.1 Disulfide-bond oxidoreductase YfcG [Methylobacterium mesophilicum]